MTLDTLLRTGISVEGIERTDGEILYFVPLTLLAKDGRFNPSMYGGHNLLRGAILDLDEFVSEEEQDELTEVLGNMVGWLYQSGQTGEMGIPIISYQDEPHILIRYVEAGSSEKWEMAYLLLIANATIEDGRVVYSKGALLEWNATDLADLGISIKTEADLDTGA